MKTSDGMRYHTCRRICTILKEKVRYFCLFGNLAFRRKTEYTKNIAPEKEEQA